MYTACYYQTSQSRVKFKSSEFAAKYLKFLKNNNPSKWSGPGHAGKIAGYASPLTTNRTMPINDSVKLTKIKITNLDSNSRTLQLKKMAKLSGAKKSCDYKTKQSCDYKVKKSCDYKAKQTTNRLSTLKPKSQKVSKQLLSKSQSVKNSVTKSKSLVKSVKQIVTKSKSLVKSCGINSTSSKSRQTSQSVRTDTKSPNRLGPSKIRTINQDLSIHKNR